MKFLTVVVAFAFCCLTEAEVQNLKCCWIKPFNDKITRAFWICSQPDFRYCCYSVLCPTLIFLFCKTNSWFSPVLCASAISFRLEVFLLLFPQSWGCTAFQILAVPFLFWCLLWIKFNVTLNHGWLFILPVQISDPSQKWEPWSVHRIYCASDHLPFFSLLFHHSVPTSSRIVDFLISFVFGCLASLLFKWLVRLYQRCACGTVWDHCDLNFLSLWLKADQWKITLFLSFCFQFLLHGSVWISY